MVWLCAGHKLKSLTGVKNASYDTNMMTSKTKSPSVEVFLKLITTNNRIINSYLWPVYEITKK